MDGWDVNCWLEEIGYDKRYAQAFIDNGYDLPNLCANLKDEDLDAIEVDKEDRNRLFEHVERLRHHSFARIPISYSPVLDRNTSTRYTVNSNGNVGNGLPSFTRPPLDNFGASQEPSVKSPDSLGSVSHELPEHTPPCTTEVQLYSEALNQSSTHPPKKPPRNSKKTGKSVPPTLPLSSSNNGLSRLQLKLKLKEELQKDHIVINEPPYIQESGEANEELLQQLAVDYANKFGVDSLEMYEALTEFWRVQNNRSGQATPMTGGEMSKLSPGQDKMTSVQKQPSPLPITYMRDPHNGPPVKPPRRAAPAPLHYKHGGSEKGKIEKLEEKAEPDLVSNNFNSSVNNTMTGPVASTKSYSAMNGKSLSSPPSTCDVFLYDDVHGVADGVNHSYIDSHLRELSSEKERASFLPHGMIVSSESASSFNNQSTPDKVPGKKRGGLKKFLTRNSKKKISSSSSTGSGSVSAGNLLANTITMSDEERVILMEKFKKQELSESEVLSKVMAYEEQQKIKRDELFNELSQEDLPPRSGVLMPLEMNGSLANGKLNRLLPASKANIKRSQSTEAVDNVSLSSSGSSSDLDPALANHKQSAGVIASALKFFKKRGPKDATPKNTSSNLTHSSSMPSIVIEEKLNVLSKSEKTTVPPPPAPSAYSEVFDRIIPPDSGGQSTSLPRSTVGSASSSNSSSSSTLPSRGSPATSPGIKPKQTPLRYRQKQQPKQQPNGCIKKTSPLTKTKTDLTRIVQRQSSPEILMCTVNNAGVVVERENEDEENLQTDVTQEQVEQKPENEIQSGGEKSQPTEIFKKNEDVQSNTSDVNVLDTAVDSAPTTTTVKPAVTRRPKVPPKPSLPMVSITDHPTPEVKARVRSLESHPGKPPVPKPRAKTPSSDEARHSCSPVCDDVFDSNMLPPAKPPRRSTQTSSSRSLSGTPSPMGSRPFFSTVLPSTFAVEEHREKIISSTPSPSGQVKPVLPPKPRRKISSTSTVGLESSLVAVADNLNIDEIDLGNIPYSTTWGECGIPVPLIERYAHELNTTFDEMTQCLDQVRKHRLEQCQRVWVPMDKNYTVNNQNVDTSSLKAWMASIGLPMYYSQLTKIGIRNVESVKRISIKTYDQMQFRLPMHGMLLHKAVQALCRN